MELSSTVLFGILGILIYVLRRLWRRSSNSNSSIHRVHLPCLPSLPFVGSLPFLPSDIKAIPHSLMKTAEKLGPIFAFYTGSRWKIFPHIAKAKLIGGDGRRNRCTNGNIWMQMLHTKEQCKCKCECKCRMHYVQPKQKHCILNITYKVNKIWWYNFTSIAFFRPYSHSRPASYSSIIR